MINSTNLSAKADQAHRSVMVPKVTWDTRQRVSVPPYRPGLVPIWLGPLRQIICIRPGPLSASRLIVEILVLRVLAMC
jgi:hypothetical protein